VNRNPSPLALLFIAALLLAAAPACRPGAPAQTPTPPPPASPPPAAGHGIHDIGDPCRLLTQADAAQLFGHAADAGISNFGNTSASCTYTSATAGELLTLNVLYETGPAQSSTDYTQLKTPDVRPMPGLGDDAYFNSAFHLLTVAWSHWVFTLNAALGSPTAGVDRLKPLAQTVLSRLPN